MFFESFSDRKEENKDEVKEKLTVEVERVPAEKMTSASADDANNFSPKVSANKFISDELTFSIKQC